MSTALQVLVVDDEEFVCERLKAGLEARGLVVHTARGYDEAIKRLQVAPPAIVVSDIRMPGGSGIELTRWIRGRLPETLVILMTGHASVDNAAEGLRLGAFDYLLKPFDDLELVTQTVQRGLERQRLEKEKRALRRQAAEAAQLKDLRLVVGNIAKRLRREAPTRTAHQLLDELEDALTPARRAVTSSIPIVAPPPPTRDRPRVLAVDDEPYIVRAIRRLLRNRCEVVTAVGGGGALAVLAEDRDFDAILLDITMPDIHGFKVFERIGEMDPDLQSRVVFCSGVRPAGMESLVAGQAAFVGKPFTLDQLLKAIEAVTTKLGRRTGKPQATSN